MDSKSRKEKRKEARLGNNKQKHQSWLQHQESQRKRKLGDRKSNEGNGIKKKDSQTRFLEQNEIVQQTSEHSNKAKMVKGEKGFKRTSKTKFEEYLEMEMPNADMLAEQDRELERKLAKKLKVKGGKLGGDDDGLDMLFEDDKYALESWTEGFPDDEDLLDPSSKKNKKKKIVEQVSEDEIGDDSSFAALDLEEDARMSSEDIPAKAQARKRRRKRKSLQQKQEGDMAGETACSGSQPAEIHSEEVAVNAASAKAPEMDGNVKYVAPHLRSRARNESEEHTQIRRRVRGLLNRLSESNVESITAEIASIFRSTSRSVSSEIISQEVLVSCYNGPRGNEQYAAVFAAFVAGMACSVGMDFSAKLIASLAKTFEEEYLKEDNLSLRNLTLLLSYLCIFGVCSSDLIYDFLIMLSKRLTEIDVATILTILQCCGLKIRGDDPATMKNFILTVQNRVNELRASSGDGNAKINGKRMEFMLETICDIKNNKKKPKEDTVQHTRIKKWLQKLKAEDILLRGLKWSKLLDPEKKGQWWLSGDMISATDDVEEIANTIDKEAREAQKMLELAAAQRMNTDARRAIFCVIMSGEDYIDTFEKLLRLDLPGKQDRDIMRVLVECCLQEKVFNKYYTVLAAKLCEHEKNHKFTLQFCLWDHLKELDSVPLIRSMHLAKFIAEMVASFTLSLAVLKTVEWSDPKMLSAKRIMHFRMLFEAIFEYSDKLIWNMFTRIAVTPELETLRQGMEFFIREYVVKTNKKVMNKFKVAKKALNNTEGVLM
ncbi:MIF4G-like, type 3 [Corchorus capsularis]|uniref:MIF4G-like, type 3 n=1 Tax=Corchorus capsularis TaxID=210143 RepID=A0A1R3HC76_COCAP|nr:MIF4G-like, type 3 [Corchorus capsularis]